MSKKQARKQKLETFIRESCLVAGFFMLGYGLWLVYPPAMFLVCGVLLMWLGLPPKPKKGGD